jgi:hypothetical protein
MKPRDVFDTAVNAGSGAGRALAMAFAAAMGFWLGATPALAAGRFCSATAFTLRQACQSDANDNFFVARAKCNNLSDPTARKECFVEAWAARKEDVQLCREQLAWRRLACKSLGEDRYDPEVDPALFDDPRNPTKPNPYFPLSVGNKWEYRGEGEVNNVEVVDETKLIEGVRCIVFRDQVFKDGDLAEDTDDWFAPAKDGNVWYFGEEVKDFESFDGDEPRRPELVKIDGSFKAGRDGDKPGVIFQASPKPGQTYLEEFSLGNAEDMTQILSTTYKYGDHPELDRLVPQALAERFCSGDCVVTKNISLLEPGVVARKYYGRGVGFFLEISLDTGKVLQLVNCSFDSRCVHLPMP